MHENTPPLYNSTYTMTPFSDNTGPIGGTDGPIRFGSLRSPVARQHPPTRTLMANACRAIHSESSSDGLEPPTTLVSSPVSPPDRFSTTRAFSNIYFPS